MSSGNVVSIRTGMRRRLDNLNEQSFLHDIDNSRERLSVEIAMRRLDGISCVHYWLVDMDDEPFLNMRRSLKSWLRSFPAQYSEHVRIIVPSDKPRLIEAPIQLSTSLSAWLDSYWGIKEARLKDYPGDEILLSSVRMRLV
ncbi:hypothetical protein ACI2KR_08405 [Pseudomonas luteola]